MSSYNMIIAQVKSNNFETLENHSKCTEEDLHTVPAFACDSKITTLASSLFTYTSESTV